MSKVKLNDEQRPAVDQHDQSLLLSAGAGSGKTRVLVERYLRILEAGAWDPNLPARLLAITFTERAAQEMRERIYREVAERAAESSPVEAERLAELGRELETAPISTIHGFCSRLLRENAAEAGLDPRFRVPDLVEQRELEDKVVADLLAEENADLILLAGEFGLEKLRDGLKEHRELRRSLGILARTDEDAEALAASQKEAVLQLIRERWTAWQKQLPARFAELCDHLPGASHPAAKQGEKIAEALAILAQTGEELDADLPARLSAAMFRFTSKGKKIDDEGHLAAKWGLLKDELKDAAKTLMPLSNAEPDPRPPGMRAAFFRLQAELDRRLNQGMRERAWLDFEDLQLVALHMLEKDPALRDRLRGQFTQILVDEMQDTNQLQLRLIRQLAPEDAPSGRTLFLVGDPRQSIYGFRNADVEVFRAEAARAQVRGESRSLSYNYRSHPALLNFFNAFFPEDEFPAMASPDQTEGAPRVHIQLAVTGESNTQTARHRAAEALAQTLRQAYDSGLAVKDGDGHRPLDWKDVAILVRSGNAISPLVRALTAQDIPHEASGGKEYFIRQELLDLENLIAALDDPYHRFKLARGLRSEAIGLSRRDLVALMLPGANDTKQQRQGRILLDRLAAAVDGELGLSPDGQSRIDSFLKIRREIGPRLHRLPMQQLIMEVVRVSGFDYRAATERYGLKMLRNLRQLSELLGELERHRRMAVGDFLGHMQRIREISPKRQEAWVPEEGESLVKILTIHSAKGLEFPLVVVADLERDLSSVRSPDDFASLRLPSGADQAAILGLNWRDGLGGKHPDILHTWIREASSKREAEESRRLFYVAVTRAMDYLILSGVMRKKSQEEAAEEFADIPKKAGAHFLAELRRGLHAMDPALYSLTWIQSDSPTELGDALGRPAGETTPATPAPEWAPLAANIEHPAELELPVTSLSLLHACPLRWVLERRYSLDGSARGLPEPFHPREEKNEDGPSGAAFGTDLHRILEHWNFSSPADQAFADACPADLDEKRRDAARKTLLDFFAEENVWTEQRLPQGEDFRREESFVLKLEGLRITGQIDLHFQWQGQRFLVDWKSDRVDDATILDRIHHHQLQMALYALALREAGRPASRAFIAFLRAGQFREVDVDERHLKWAENLVLNLARMAADLTRPGQISGGLESLPSPHEPPCRGCPWREGPCSGAYRKGELAS